MFDGATLLSDCLVVVRGIGERTEEAAINLFKEYMGLDNVEVVTGNPFSVTLKRSFEVAIARGFPWTFCVDADVLMFPDTLHVFSRMVRTAPDHLYGIQGLVLDKWFGGMRAAGMRIYRTALLDRALKFIPDGEESKRPETFTRRAMQRNGYEYISRGFLCGLHDFEQYYEDVYRTVFFHAQKHKYFMPLLLPYWERMSTQDPDFLVALRAMNDGLREKNVLGLDARNFSERAAFALADLGIVEKKKLNLSHADVLSFIERTVSGWQTPPEYDAFVRQTRRPSRMARLLGPSFLRRLGLSGVLEQ